MHRGSSVCFHEIFLIISLLLSDSPGEGCGARKGRSLLLEEGVPGSWGATLPHASVDKWCPKDEPKKMISWMEQYMTCHIPDDETNPELHRLVTKYQAHKCSNYCRRRRKRGKMYITHCRFGFPRETCESTTLHNVQEKRKKIYELQRNESEKRINDYNPLPLLLSLRSKQGMNRMSCLCPFML